MDKTEYLDSFIGKSRRIIKKTISKIRSNIKDRTVEGYKNPGEGDANEHNYDGHHGPHVNIPLLDLFWMPHQKSIMKYIVIWMAFNMFGMFIMIFMVDMQGDGLIKGGMVSRFFSALLRVITMNSFAVKVVKEVEEVKKKDEDDEQSGGNSKRKKTATLLLRATYFLVFTLLMAILFPSKIINIVERFAPVEVPISNIGKAGKNMDKNYQTTQNTIRRMRSGPDSTVTLDAEKQLANIARRNEELNAGFRNMDARFSNGRYEWDSKKNRYKAKIDANEKDWFPEVRKQWENKKKVEAVEKLNSSMQIN